MTHEDKNIDRVTVSEAAQRLGVTQDAIRQRVKRSTIKYDKESDGRVYVYLDPTMTPRDNTLEKSHEELVDALRDQVAHLKDEVDAWREEARRKDHLLAAALGRIPELEASETTRIPSGEYGEEPNDDEEHQQEDLRPWWFKWLGPITLLALALTVLNFLIQR
jgi:hypothetical protein